MSKVALEGMRFYAYHGAHKEERFLGNNFLVSVSLELDFSKIQEDESIKHTVNYADVYEVCKTEMEKPTRLLESLAYRILNKVKDISEKIESTTVTISKEQPPLGGEVKYATVEVSG